MTRKRLRTANSPIRCSRLGEREKTDLLKSSLELSRAKLRNLDCRTGALAHGYDQLRGKAKPLPAPTVAKKTR